MSYLQMLYGVTRHRAITAIKYGLASLAVLTILSCGGQGKVTESQNSVRLSGSVNCERSPYGDSYKRVVDVIKETVEGKRVNEGGTYRESDVIIKLPDGSIGYGIDLKRPLTSAEEKIFNEQLAEICPQ